MITRGLCSAIVAAVLVAGCVNQPKDQQSAGAAAPVESPPSALPAPGVVDSSVEVDPAPGTVQALVQRAQSYSRELEQAMAQRTAPADAPRDAGAAPAASPAPSPAPSATPAPAPVPSQVQWIDPGTGQLRPLDAPPPPSPLASGEPAPSLIHTSPSAANLPASVLPTDGAPPPPNGPVAANIPAPEEATAAPAAVTISPATMSNAGQLANRLSARVRDNPRDVSAHLDYQLLQFLLDEQVPQLSTLAALPTEDRELVTTVLDGLSLFRSTLRSDNNMLLSRKIRPLLDMADRLRSQADLTIQTVTLCRAVRGFGDYEPIEPARFIAGAEHKAILYCEIANFSSNLNDAGSWQTQLRLDLTLYTEFGAAVWNDGDDSIIDVARSRRSDFFINKRITIPANLTLGRFLLKVSVVDVQANRVAEATVPIVIMAQ